MAAENLTYRGVLPLPAKSSTTHHSIVKYNGKWQLFYHDTKLSGKNNSRNVKATELNYKADGTIQTIAPLPTEPLIPQSEEFLRQSLQVQRAHTTRDVGV